MMQSKKKIKIKKKKKKILPVDKSVKVVFFEKFPKIFNGFPEINYVPF